ncbi:hypothetical protein T265_11364 [Opisthorchis viverrini]|uniref:Uncharacterized protein n=1 Tax=Opisthorchis viverrini TaxID=6198 RepID=A0A074YYW6_OPIVI|nr:hypothetical protein T265_11364 [Opisthorchis viverrini]KER19986.1 hypothetical protein T265_11364 [Opisthorchis viverrini]
MAAIVSSEPADGEQYIGSKDVITRVLNDNPARETPGIFAITAGPDNPIFLLLNNDKAHIVPSADSGIHKFAGKILR